jgi:dihydroorotase
MIDSHVHCRDWKQSHKETIAHALTVAERVGLSGIFDMPNTDPPITSRELVEKRLSDARKANSPVFYGLYIGITSDPNQIREAVDLHRTHFPKPRDKVGVIGLKMFAGKSVGDLSVVGDREQQRVYQTLAEANYLGVLAVHCEDEDYMKPESFNPRFLHSHATARPEISEVESIADQIWYARMEGYKGHLHICHVSTLESVDRVNLFRNLMKLSCGVTLAFRL